MEYIYAAMLIHKAGKAVDEATLKKVLDAAGIAVDAAKIKAVVAALDGVNIDETIKNASVPVAAATAPAAAFAAPAKEDKKADAQDAKKAEESAAAGLGALFG